jgi:hypothetical protein
MKVRRHQGTAAVVRSGTVRRRPCSLSTFVVAAACAMVCLALVQVGALGTAGAASKTGRTSPNRTRHATVPGAPTGVVATPGNANASIVWNPPASNGGSPITGYIIIPSSGRSVSVGSVNSGVISGLTNGATYTFTVESVNSEGVGPASARSNPVTPRMPSGQAAPAFLLPLYDSSSADWQTACSGLANSDSLVIADIGDPGGPGTAENAAWASNIGICGGTHVGVLGYVDTGFCQIPLSTVESQIDSWYAWYGSVGLSGIFFDEAANPVDPAAMSDCLSRSTDALNYYRTIAAYAHGKASDQTVSFNFGVNPVSNWPLSSTVPGQNADVAVIFEDPYSDFVNYGGSGAAWSPAQWESSFGPQHFSVLVYDATGTGQPSTFCSAALRQNVGRVYVAPNSGWNTLPPTAYFKSELADC